MGKIEISEDLRNKLNKVLSYKSTDLGESNISVGPAPKWTPPPHPPQPPQPQSTYQHVPPPYPQQPQQPYPQQPQQPYPQQPQQPYPQQPQQPYPQQPQQPYPQQQHQHIPLIYPIKSEYYFHKYSEIKHKNKNKKKITYYKISKIVFVSSIVAGIGITLGLKIANILFF